MLIVTTGSRPGMNRTRVVYRLLAGTNGCNNIVPLTMGRIPALLHSSLFVGLVFDSPPPIYATMETLTHPPHTHPTPTPQPPQLRQANKGVEKNRKQTVGHLPSQTHPQLKTTVFNCWTYSFHHRVDRVPGFLSNSPNWLHPPPSPPLVPGGGGTLSLAGEGQEEPIFGRRDRHSGTQGELHIQ